MIRISLPPIKSQSIVDNPNTPEELDEPLELEELPPSPNKFSVLSSKVIAPILAVPYNKALIYNAYFLCY